MLIHLLLPFQYMISPNAYLFICEIFINDKLQMLIHLLLPFQYMISPNAYLFASIISMYDKLKCISNYL